MGKVVGDVGKSVGKFQDILSKIPVAGFGVGVAPEKKSH